MKKLLAVFAFLLAGATAAQDFTPVQGHYWSPDESGTGYNISIQNGTMVTAIYSFTPAGKAQWYLVICNFDGDTCSGALQKYADGQSIGGSYVAPIPNGNDGTATFKWVTESRIEVLLPQARKTVIVPLEFKRNNGAAAMLGKWVFIAFDSVGNTRVTPVLNFTEINKDNNVVRAPDQSAECKLLLLGIFGCKILDIDGLPSAVWTVRPIFNDARGASGNVLDGDIVVQGYRLNPTEDASPD